MTGSVNLLYAFLLGKQLYGQLNRCLSQISLVPYITATSGSVSTGPLQAAVSPVTYQACVIPKTLQDPYIHNDPQCARQASPLSLYTTVKPFIAVDTWAKLLCTCSIHCSCTISGFCRCCRLQCLSSFESWKMGLERNGRKMGWSLSYVDARQRLTIYQSDFERLSPLMVHSVGSMALLGSIKNRIADVSQGLEAHQIHPYLGKYRLILSRLVEGTISPLCVKTNEVSRPETPISSSNASMIG